jgi:ABC-2 type transport system ATP-binding protein
VNLLKDEILSLKENGATIIFSTHNMSSVEEICDDISLLNKSKVVLEGNVHEIKNRYKSNLYNIEFNSSIVDFKLIIPEHYMLINQEEEHNITKLQIRLPKEVTSNELLNLFLSKYNITKFNEILPTMNEVFISSIKNS